MPVSDSQGVKLRDEKDERKNSAVQLRPPVPAVVVSGDARSSEGAAGCVRQRAGAGARDVAIHKLYI
jgi:hypothetical protein